MNIKAYKSFLTKQELSLPFYVATIGNPKYQPPVYRKNGIEDHQILYTRSGSGICYINNEKLQLEPKSILFLPFHSTHHYMAEKNEWETLYITFNGSGFNNFFHYKSKIIKSYNNINFENYYNKLSNLKYNNQYNLLSIYLYKFLVELNSVFSEIFGNTLKNKSKIDTALKIINSNNFCTVSDIAYEINITEEHFCRIFKQYMGYRPVEYINILKLQRAREMLSDSSLHIYDIAYSVGFNDISYFCKLFKKAFGISPSKYRKHPPFN